MFFSIQNWTLLRIFYNTGLLSETFPCLRFKGIREGGVGENAAFYVFTHAADGAIDAYPLCEWYNFQPINRYKSLSAEEAELEFGR